MSYNFKIVFTFAFLAFAALGAESSCRPEWKLVFVAVSGNGEEVYPRWIERLPHGCCQMRNGCLPEDLSLAFTSPPARHLKSPLVDKWTKLGIQKVKVELFKDGIRRAYLVFDGRGSTSVNWFSKTKLLENSWEDLDGSGTFNYFSMAGFNNGRRFHINQLYKGCPLDVGWLVVVDNHNYDCPWDRHAAYPAILWSGDVKIKWNTLNFQRADYMAISIETQDVTSLV